MPIAHINGLDIYYERYGQGSPLLNISGSGGDLRRSNPSRSPLNKHFDVVHFDQRGLGRSAKPEGPYSMADYADDAAALLHEMGWDSAHVVGTSFGGMVAQNLALQHPDRIDRLVLNCTSPGGIRPSFPLHELAKLDSEAAIEIKLGLYDSRWDPGADDPIPDFGPFYDDMIEQMRTNPEPGSEEHRGSRLQLEARAGHDVYKQLKNIQATTLVCAGEFDDLAPLENSVVMVENMPNARLQVFQGGHLFMIQDRTAFASMIEFLEG